LTANWRFDFQTMMWEVFLRSIGFALSILIAAAVLAPAEAAFGQAGASPVVGGENRFHAEAPPEDAEIVNLVLGFAPGVWLPLHTHGGPGYATVLEGQMTRRASGAEQTFGRGQGWIDSAEIPHQAGNDGVVPARIVATFVIPKGATLTTVVETDADTSSPGASTFAELRFDAHGLPSPLDLVHRVVDAAAGAELPAPSHPGVAVGTMLQGTGKLVGDGAMRSVTAGDSWTNRPDDAAERALLADTHVQLVVTHLVPSGSTDATIRTGSTHIPAQVPVQMPAAR
jgi:quercetin dioxygenase-like cupin family protein